MKRGTLKPTRSRTCNSITSPRRSQQLAQTRRKQSVARQKLSSTANRLTRDVFLKHDPLQFAETQSNLAYEYAQQAIREGHAKEYNLQKHYAYTQKMHDILPDSQGSITASCTITIRFVDHDDNTIDQTLVTRSIKQTVDDDGSFIANDVQLDTAQLQAPSEYAIERHHVVAITPQYRDSGAWVADISIRVVHEKDAVHDDVDFAETYDNDKRQRLIEQQHAVEMVDKNVYVTCRMPSPVDPGAFINAGEWVCVIQIPADADTTMISTIAYNAVKHNVTNKLGNNAFTLNIDNDGNMLLASVVLTSTQLPVQQIPHETTGHVNIPENDNVRFVDIPLLVDRDFVSACQRNMLETPGDDELNMFIDISHAITTKVVDILSNAGVNNVKAQAVTKTDARDFYDWCADSRHAYRLVKTRSLRDFLQQHETTFHDAVYTQPKSRAISSTLYSCVESLSTNESWVRQAKMIAQRVPTLFVTAASIVLSTRRQGQSVSTITVVLLHA